MPKFGQICQKKRMDILSIARRVFEIEAQALHQLNEQLSPDFEKAVQIILACSGKVVICGMGKSGLIGQKIAATLASTGTPSFFMHPAEAFHGDLGMITKNDVVVGLSNSGETEEIIRLIPTFKNFGNPFIVLCGNPQSTMVKNADCFLDVSVRQEACPLQLAPTASTTATLAMGDALAVALMEVRGFQPENFAVFHPGGSLGKKLLAKVKDAMFTQNLPIVLPTISVKELILEMTKKRLGLALVSQNDHLVGIVTDGDLRRAWQNFDDLKDKTAADLMSSSPKTLHPEDSWLVAENFFLEHKIVSAPVLEHQKIVGVLQVYQIK